MWQEYAPEERMRLNLGIRRRLAPLLDNHPGKIRLANSLLFTLPGAPIIYYGDEIGMGDNIWLDDRHGVRTPMQWSDEPKAGFSEAKPEALYSPIIEGKPYSAEEVNVENQIQASDSIYQSLRKMIALRKQHRLFGFGDFQWVEINQGDKVLGYRRNLKGESVLVLNNMSSQEREVSLASNELGEIQLANDLMNEGRAVKIVEGELQIRLEGFDFAWLKLS